MPLSGRRFRSARPAENRVTSTGGTEHACHDAAHRRRTGPAGIDMIDAETVERYRLPGHLRSVPDEIDAVDLPVTGTLPPELTGRYVRNGPNALPGEVSGHAHIGPGMLHGVRLREGRAEWYRNRWVRTGRFHGRPFAGP